MSDNSFRVLTEEHILEAERLKKAWYDLVLSSLEQLGKNIEKLSSDLSSAKEDLHKQIIEVKDLLHFELKERRLETDADLDKLEKRIEKKLDELNASIKSLTVSGVKEELIKEINKLENKIAVIHTKMAIIAVGVSLVGIAIAEGFGRLILPIILKAF